MSDSVGREAVRREDVLEFGLIQVTEQSASVFLFTNEMLYVNVDASIDGTVYHDFCLKELQQVTNTIRGYWSYPNR